MTGVIVGVARSTGIRKFIDPALNLLGLLAIEATKLDILLTLVKFFVLVGILESEDSARSLIPRVDYADIPHSPGRHFEIKGFLPDIFSRVTVSHVLDTTLETKDVVVIDIGNFRQPVKPVIVDSTLKDILGVVVIPSINAVVRISVGRIVGVREEIQAAP